MGVVILLSIFSAVSAFYLIHAVLQRHSKSTLTQKLLEEQDKITRLQQALHEMTCEKERLYTAYRKDQQFWEQQKSTLYDMENRWKETFENITNKMLRSSEENLTKATSLSLEQFRKNLHTTLHTQDTAFTKMEKSFQDGMVSLSTHIGTLSKDQAFLNKALQEQKTLLVDTQGVFRNQSDKLLHALKTPQVRGQWGEIQLKRIIELAGMQKHCDFSEQKTHGNTHDADTIRPDVLIHLPENKHIIIDAKAPLGHYLEAINTDDSQERQKRMLAHAKQVWTHVTTLSSKKYWEHFNAPDFVILFLPGEPFLSTALEQDPSLLERAAEHSVIIATPSTLMALLKAIHYGWKNLQVAENIKNIIETSTTLLKRADAFAQHFQKIGSALATTNSCFNKAVSSFEKRLLPSARKLQKVGLGSENRDLDIPYMHEYPQTQTSPQDSQ